METGSAKSKEPSLKEKSLTDEDVFIKRLKDIRPELEDKYGGYNKENGMMYGTQLESFI